MGFIKRIFARFFRLFRIFLYVAKIPGYVVWILDYIFGIFFLLLRKIAQFIDSVMLRPCHNTRPYRWYKKMDDSSRLAFWVILITVVWIFSGSFGGAGNRFGGQNKDGEQLRSVQIEASVAQSYQPLIEISGVTEANHKLDIRAQTAGTVQEIVKLKGSELEVDEVFLELDNTIRNAELKQATASYNQLRLENQAATSLAKGGYQSRVKATEIQANFARAEASLAQARYNLAKSRFSAPFAGTLVDLPLDIGDYVSPGIFVGTVIDLDPIKITGYVSEKEVQSLEGLGEIEVRIDDESYVGQLVFISTSANSRTRSFAVEVIVENPDESIRDGVPATLRLLQNSEEAHFISSAWLTLNSDGTIGVRVVDEEDVVVFLPVDIIQDTDKGVWISELPSKINIITVGQETVTVGEKVKAVE